MVQRIKSMDEEGQRYKDENWNLQIQLQEIEASLRDTTDKHDKALSGLKTTQSEKAAKERELDEVKVAHEKLQEDHSSLTRQHEAETHTLRRDLITHQTEKEGLAKRVEYLTSQNTELARGLSYRFNQPGQGANTDATAATRDLSESDDAFADPSEPSSPVKGTPARHGMLEAETMKSSLNHAHRMIQNLKNNIHREKTEKIELKRMLQEARDELESGRRDSSASLANMAKKRDSNSKFKKPAPRNLGANRSSVTEVMEDEPEWEDHDGERTPSKSRMPGTIGGFDHAAFGGAAQDTETERESTDAFETANERDTTENEAFETGHESMAGDSDGDLTETEAGILGLGRSSTIRAASGSSPLASRKAGDRRSFQSTASTSADEADEVVRTPVQQSFGAKYKLRMNGRGGRRPSGRVADLAASESPAGQVSPTSSTGTPQGAGQTLGDELEGMDDGTPNSTRSFDDPQSPATVTGAELPQRALFVEGDEGEENREPEISSPVLSEASPKVDGEQAQMAHQANAAMLAHEFALSKAKMVDACVGTDPWEPENQAVGQKEPAEAEHEDEEGHHQTLLERAEDVVGGALAGFGLGRIGRSKDAKAETEAEEAAPAGMEDEDEKPEEITTDLAAPETADVGQVEPKTLGGAEAEPLLTAKASSDALRGNVQAAPFELSGITSQETEPVTPPRPVSARTTSADGLQEVRDVASKPEVPLAAAAPLAVGVSDMEAAQSNEESKHRPQPLTFSTIEAQDFEPIALPDIPTPIVPKRSSRRLDGLYNADEPETHVQDFSSDAKDLSAMPGTDSARPGAAFFATTGGLVQPSAPLLRSRSKSMPAKVVRGESAMSERSIIEPKVFGGVRNSQSGIPTLVFGDEDDSGTEHHYPMPGDLRSLTPQSSAREVEPTAQEIKPLQISKKPVAMADEGSQTMISGSDIDEMLRSKSRTGSMATTTTEATGGAPASPLKQTSSAPTRRSVDGAAAASEAAILAGAARAPRRPASAGSMRNRAAERVPPPLPENYTQKIAAVKRPTTPGPASGAGTMGPPLMPASAYRQKGPRTPSEQGRAMSRDGTTPRPVRHRDSRGQIASSGLSRRTSVSSFASELDERFNITRGDVMYPSDVVPATDPRMIQAITQTMIGEYLWKYTRKAGRSETSNTRHRRFFWVHPYTRTLYWSESDPSTAGRNMLKAKSMGITSVRVVTDDNAYPPGLHRKSIVVVTPGREIVFTAPTGQRHETWFNALSYLLLRTEQEKAEAEDTMDQDDLDEFGPRGFISRSISRMTGGRDRSQSRLSLSSYNSRTTRTSSPQRKGEAASGQGSLAQRQSQAALRAKAAASPTPAAVPTLTPTPATTGVGASTGTALSRSSTMRDSGSISGRFSSLTSRFRPGSSQRGSFSTTGGRGRSSFSTQGRNPADPSEIYDASVVTDSAEDLRAVIERQEREEGGRIENVRSCCDGKFPPST